MLPDMPMREDLVPQLLIMQMLAVQTAAIASFIAIPVAVRMIRYMV